MKQAAREWMKKAGEDYLAALDLSRRRNRQLHNSVCFHCQQCAE
jgi:HEPN domain-containing protein